MARRLAGLLGATLLVAFFACGDPYQHTNPYDPAHPVQMAIAGPDTLFSLEEVGQYTVQTNPPWPDTGFVWSTDTTTNYFIVPVPTLCIGQVVDGSTILHGNGGGAYQSIAPPLEPYVFKVAIGVQVGTIDTTVSVGVCGAAGGSVTVQTNASRHVAYKTVVVTQRVTRIQLRCPDTHACAPLAVDDSAFIWVDGFDALGRQIYALTSSTANPASNNPPFQNFWLDSAIVRSATTNNPVVSYLSRDSTIARTTPIGIRVVRVTGVQPGSTWVVATRGALRDSLQIVVR